MVVYWQLVVNTTYIASGSHSYFDDMRRKYTEGTVCLTLTGTRRRVYHLRDLVKSWDLVIKRHASNDHCLLHIAFHCKYNHCIRTPDEPCVYYVNTKHLQVVVSTTTTPLVLLVRYAFPLCGSAFVVFLDYSSSSMTPCCICDWSSTSVVRRRHPSGRPLFLGSVTLCLLLLSHSCFWPEVRWYMSSAAFRWTWVSKSTVTKLFCCGDEVNSRCRSYSCQLLSADRITSYNLWDVWIEHPARIAMTRRHLVDHLETDSVTRLPWLVTIVLLDAALWKKCCSRLSRGLRGLWGLSLLPIVDCCSRSIQQVGLCRRVTRVGDVHCSILADSFVRQVMWFRAPSSASDRCLSLSSSSTYSVFILLWICSCCCNETP